LRFLGTGTSAPSCSDLQNQFHLTAVSRSNFLKIGRSAPILLLTLGLELINPAHPKLLAFEVQQIQISIRLFYGFSRYLEGVCERYGRFGC